MSRLNYLKNQAGLAPAILIIGLLSLAGVAAGGYYFLANQNKPTPSIAQPQKTPAPSVTQGSSIEQVKEIHEESLLNMEGVEKVEVGEKDEKPCIVVFTFKETDELQKLENEGIGGYEVKIENQPQ